MESTLTVDKKPKVVWLDGGRLFWGSSRDDSKAKNVEVVEIFELTRVASVSPPFGFQFKCAKHEYAFHAKDAAECTAWLRALVGSGARPCSVLSETTLDLAAQSLSKFPKSFLIKQGLQRIVLSENHLTKLPDDFGSYAKLEVLEANSNQLKAIPDSFGYLASLKELNLSENNVVSLPTTLEKLVTLTSLTLSANKFTEVSLVIFALTALESLNFSYNSIVSGTISSDIGKLIHLRSLDLSGCRLATLPDSIGNLSALRVLEVFKNNLTVLPDSIGNLKLLSQLRVGRNRLTSIPANLPESLEELDLSHNTALNDLPSSIGTCRVYIDFVECPLSAIPAEHRSTLNALKAFLATRK